MILFAAAAQLNILFKNEALFFKGEVGIGLEGRIISIESNGAVVDSFCFLAFQPNSGPKCQFKILTFVESTGIGII